jgi:aconitate hydratase
MVTIETTPELVRTLYDQMEQCLHVIRGRLQRPLTLAEKVLFGHLDAPERQDLLAGSAYLSLRPDRVIMQDATAQMAILQFMQAQLPRVTLPTTVHCDHLIQAYQGAAADTARALDANREVYEFLRSACARYGIGFWEPGSGIIHQVVLENYAFPGGMIIGSDSHTPNMGGLGMVAIGVGGADTVDVMAGFPWEVLQPRLIGVRLTGELSGWAAPKDVILYVCGRLTVKGGTNRIIEYFGPGARTLSATGKATICNMGAEIGATTSLFPYDQQSERYLRATERGALADLANAYQHLVTADPEVEDRPETFFDEVIDLDLSTLEPYVVGPHSPDLARPVSQLAQDVRDHDYPERIAVALVGSCTNSSYEDMVRAAHVADQAITHGSRMAVPFLINCGSALIYETVKRDGILGRLEAVGATILANACGPCIGQWKRDEFKKGERNAIINSFNRNFPGRNDANPETYAFVASPEIVMAYGLAGTLTFNPLTELLRSPDGHAWSLTPPPRVDALPQDGYTGRRKGYVAPPVDGSRVSLAIPEGSDRLHVLDPFEPMVESELAHMPVLIKTMGKTTTDHISPAGPWLRFRGHLDKISDNMLTGAINAWTGERGKTLDVYTGEQGVDVPKVARDYKARGKHWVIVGDENYGEGSSREHAAMSPRYLGCAAVIARSFARIHESNLKKQGILPLTFINPADYERIRAGDCVSFEYLHELDPVRTVTMLVEHADGTSDLVPLKHTMTMEQIGWFQAGSALNLLNKVMGSRAPGASATRR